MAFNKDDCHGIYLIMYNSVKETIKSKNDLEIILRESGRNIDKSTLSKYWKPETKEITYEEYVNICRDVPIITKTDLVKALRKMDTNGVGYLAKVEFIEAVSTPDFKLSKREIGDILKKVDPKDEGKIQFEELADLLLSNLESFRKLGRSKIIEKEGKEQNKPPKDSEKNKKLGIQNGNKELSSIGDDNDDVMLSSRKPSHKELVDEIRIEKITTSRFEFVEPKNFKTWKKTNLRGCLFLGDVSNTNNVQDPNIESYIYKFTVNTATNVFITMSPLTILQKFDLRQIPDLGFVILKKSEEIVALSVPVDASGSVYYSGNLAAGSYTIIPFTTGAKLKSKSRDAKENFNNIRPLKKDANGELGFTSEIMTMLEDIFKICDVDGNGYLNKEEFQWYSSKTSEDEWEDDLWTELKTHVKLHNEEVSFTNFTQLIMEEITQEQGDPAPLFLTFDLFGFNQKCMIEEAVPFSITFAVENSEFIAKCFGIHNKTSLVESVLRDLVFSQGEKVSIKANFQDCNVYTWYGNGRCLIGIENLNPPSKQIPVRFSVDLEKSTNLVVYKDRLQRNVSIASGTKILAVHGVPIEPKVSISCNCLIRRS